MNGEYPDPEDQDVECFSAELRNCEILRVKRFAVY